MNESAVSPPSLNAYGGGGFLPPQRDAYLREKALEHAIELLRVLADNKLLSAGKVTEDNVIGGATLFYAFLKGEG